MSMGIADWGLPLVLFGRRGATDWRTGRLVCPSPTTILCCGLDFLALGWVFKITSRVARGAFGWCTSKVPLTWPAPRPFIVSIVSRGPHLWTQLYAGSGFKGEARVWNGLSGLISASAFVNQTLNLPPANLFILRRPQEKPRCPH